MRELAGKVAVVTGAASGIGLALCDAFAAEKMKVVLADVEPKALEAAAAKVASGGAEVLAVRTDVSDRAAVQSLADQTLARFGAENVLCNNAGVAPMGPILQTSAEDWRWLVEVNLMGVVHGISVFGPLLVAAGEGHIVNTASAAALLGPPGLGPYAATKHALLGLTETLYYELDGTGVGASVLCPLLVKTQIFRSERNRPADGGPTSYGETQKNGELMIGAIGIEPSEVAEAVVQGILADRLYLLVPHDQLSPLAEARFARIVAGENPPRGDNVGL